MDCRLLCGIYSTSPFSSIFIILQVQYQSSQVTSLSRCSRSARKREILPSTCAKKHVVASKYKCSKFIGIIKTFFVCQCLQLATLKIHWVAFSNSQLSADLVGFGNFKTETLPKKHTGTHSATMWSCQSWAVSTLWSKWLCLKAFGNTTHPKNYPKLEEVGF